jgi:hypothetical protein
MIASDTCNAPRKSGRSSTRPPTPILRSSRYNADEVISRPLNRCFGLCEQCAVGDLHNAAFGLIPIAAIGGAVVPAPHPDQAGPKPPVAPGGDVVAAVVLGELVDDSRSDPRSPESGEFFDDAGVGGQHGGMASSLRSEQSVLSWSTQSMRWPQSLVVALAAHRRGSTFLSCSFFHKLDELGFRSSMSVSRFSTVVARASSVVSSRATLSRPEPSSAMTCPIW